MSRWEGPHLCEGFLSVRKREVEYVSFVIKTVPRAWWVHLTSEWCPTGPPWEPRPGP